MNERPDLPDHSPGDRTGGIGDDAVAREGTPKTTSAAPFVLAVVLFLVFAGYAFFYLRDDPGRLVTPDGVSAIADDTVRIRVDGPFPDGDTQIIKVGYALGEDTVFVEAVVHDGCDACPTEALEVDLVLPEPIGDRRVRTGTGRALADCPTPTGPDDVPQCR